MSISQVRTYLKNIISNVDSDIYFWENSFNSETVPQIRKSKAAHIAINELSSTTLDDYRTDDVVNVELNLFFQQVRDLQPLIDSAYDVAHEIRMSAIDVKNFVNEENIKNVVLNSMSYNDEFEDNGVVIRMEISFYLTFSP